MRRERVNFGRKGRRESVDYVGERRKRGNMWWKCI